jgi:uncharacterized protein YecE (DUF72 family)
MPAFTFSPGPVSFGSGRLSSDSIRQLFHTPGVQRHPLREMASYLDHMEVELHADLLENNSRMQAWQRILQSARPEFQLIVNVNDADFRLEQVDEAYRQLMKWKKANRLAAITVRFAADVRFGPLSRERVLQWRKAFRGLPLAMEVQHESWFLPEGIGLLIDHRIAFVNRVRGEAGQGYRLSRLLTTDIAVVRLSQQQLTEGMARELEPTIEKLRQFARRVYVTVALDSERDCAVGAIDWKSWWQQAHEEAVPMPAPTPLRQKMLFESPALLAG